MFCRFCGKEILDDSKFCQFCGSPVNEIGDTAKVMTQQTQSIDCIVSNTPNEPLRIELIKTKIKKPKFNIKFFWDKYKSIIAKEIACNAKLLCVAVVFILIYLIGFRTYHRRDIQKVYYTPLNESRYDKKIPERYKYRYTERWIDVPKLELVKKEGGGLAHDFARFSGEKWVETYTKERITEKTGVNEMLVYEERRKYFKDDLSKHACYASWISVAVLILGRYLILIYTIPFIKWIIKNGNK